MENQSQENINIVPEKNNNQLMMGVGIIVVLAVVGIALFSLKGSKSGSSQQTLGSETANTGESMMDADDLPSSPSATTGSGDIVLDPNAQQVQIEAGSFYFKPNVITVKKGQKVQIVMKSVDMVHDFYIDELGVKGPMIKNGETNVVEFTPEKTGTFEYYCSVGQHRKNGQVGKITVTE